MTDIEKRRIMDRTNLSGETYFLSLLQAGHHYGFLTDSDLEKIQRQCLELLAAKADEWSRGKSSSIRTERAENIMKSNLYTIGLYLKTLPDPEAAVQELKTATVKDMYQKGRKILGAKLHTAKHFYHLVLKNKIVTVNEAYNATLGKSGIGIFFNTYNPDFEAHEIPASIDYQLCRPVTDLAGVEFIQKYLENVYLENEFCRHFAAEDIHHLLSGYDENYQHLLINIFEQVLTGAIGCLLAGGNVRKLEINPEEVRALQEELSGDEDRAIACKIRKAAGDLSELENLTRPSLRDYIEKSLPKITANILHAVRTNTLDKTFVPPLHPERKPSIRFFSNAKMADEAYREMIAELLVCRFSTDKLALIREKVKAFDDLEDVLLDARLSVKEILLLFDSLGDMEIAALIKRHPFHSDVQAVEVSEAEKTLRFSLKTFLEKLPSERRERILSLADRLVEE